MADLLFVDAHIASADGIVRGWLRTNGQRIAAFGEGRPPNPPGADVEVVEAAGALLLPGFVDVHVHGALGHEVMDADVTGLAAMARFFASHGVTAFLATTWAAGTEDTLAALEAVRAAMKEVGAGARILGAHMEGPYLNARRCGAQDEAFIRPADLGEAQRFLDTGVVRLITVAPEVGDNMSLVDACVRQGVAVSVGHSDATYDQVAEAVACGARHFTHVFNAMRPLHHREPGVVGAALTMPDVTAELIADDVHVHPVAMQALFGARGTDGVVLVTDAVRAAGMRPGDYVLGGRRVTVDDRAARLPGGALAGSILTLDMALRHLSQTTGAQITSLWPTASRNAARVAGVADRKGVIAAGMDADLVLVDPAVNVQLTVADGCVIHRAHDRDR